ncbi:MAG: nuclear transport factor 2 family protein [Gemmatimonadaceae bacterium]
MTASTHIHEQELMDVERRFWNAMKEKDAATASAMTDDQCVIVGAQGVSAIDAPTMGKLTREGKWELEQYSFDDQRRQVRFLTDDIAIVAYAVKESLVVDGERLPVEANDSSVWVRRDGQWRCALHTESLAGDPFGRDKAARYPS